MHSIGADSLSLFHGVLIALIGLQMLIKQIQTAFQNQSCLQSIVLWILLQLLNKKNWIYGEK
jgi:hypothetical protein